MKNFQYTASEFPPRPFPVVWGLLLGAVVGVVCFAVRQQFPNLPLLEWQHIAGHALTVALLVSILMTWHRLAVGAASIPAAEQVSAPDTPAWFVQSAAQAVALRDKRLRYELPVLYELVNKAEEGYRRRYQSYLGLFFLFEILLVFGGLMFGFLQNSEGYETSILSNRFLTLIVLSIEASTCLLPTMFAANAVGPMLAKWNHAVCTRLAQDDQLVIPFHEEMISTKAPAISDLPDLDPQLPPDPAPEAADDLFSRDFGTSGSNAAKPAADSPWQTGGPASGDFLTPPVRNYSPAPEIRNYSHDPEI